MKSNFRHYGQMEKQRWEESEKREERRLEKRKGQKKEDAGARKGGKVARHCVFPMVSGSGGLKSRLTKAAGAEPTGRMRDEKLHAVAARSTFRSQKAKSTSRSKHFWKLRCRKSARRSGAKHISKLKTDGFGPFLEVELLKSARRCGAKHTMYKAPQPRSTFGSWDLKKCTSLWAKHISKSKCTKQFSLGQNTSASEHFWKFRSTKRTPLWCDFEVTMCKAHRSRSTFWS